MHQITCQTAEQTHNNRTMNDLLWTNGSSKTGRLLSKNFTLNLVAGAARSDENSHNRPLNRDRSQRRLGAYKQNTFLFLVYIQNKNIYFIY